MLQKLTRWFRRRRHHILDKRQRFVIQTVILTVGVLVTQFIWEDYRFFMVVILAATSYALTAWALMEDISGLEWVYLFILPVFFTASVSLFYFLLPGRWITRLTMIVVFSLGTYAILRVENIYNVAVQRAIQLLRVARTVGLLLTLLIVFLTSSLVFSFRLWYWQNALIISVVAFCLALQSLWSITLEQKLSSSLLFYSLTVALAVGELAGIFSFWPISNASFSLMIAAGYYGLVGLIQHQLQERLFRTTIREYTMVFVFTLFLALITTRWG